MGCRCCGSHAEEREIAQKEVEGMEMVNRNIDEESNAIISTMRIEVHLKCEGLPPMNEKHKYIIWYKVEHGNSQQIFKWAEKYDCEGRPKLSKPLVLPYELGTDQVTKVSITRYEDVKDLRDPQLRTPYGYIVLDLNDVVKTPGNELRKRIITNAEANRDDESFVTLNLCEKKAENLSQLVIEMEAVDMRIRGPIYFICYQHVGEGLRLLQQSENCFADSKTPRVFSFNPLTLSSEHFEGTWEEKELCFQFIDGSRKYTPKSVSGFLRVDPNVLATANISIKELMQGQLSELPLQHRNKRFGRVVLKRKAVEPILTLGSILFSGIEIVPIIAVDYSLGNLTFDSLKCMHHFDKVRPNLYVEALTQIATRVSPFFPHICAYGVGAKVVPKKSRLSSCFALNGNIFNPAVHSKEELLEAYTKMLRRVELSLPVNYGSVLKTAKGMARAELGEYQQRYRAYQQNLNSSAGEPSVPIPNKYFILYVIASGVLDDPEEALAECEGVAELPLSIVFVKIGNQQMRDVDDLMELMKRIEQNYCARRKFMSMVEFDRVFNNLANFGKFLVSSVPAQVLQFLKLTHKRIVTRLDVQGSDKLTPGPKSSSSATEEEEKEELKQQGLDPDDVGEYLEKLKLDYYHAMRARAMKSEDIEAILHSGIPDTDPDLPSHL